MLVHGCKLATTRALPGYGLPCAYAGNRRCFCSSSRPPSATSRLWDTQAAVGGSQCSGAASPARMEHSSQSKQAQKAESESTQLEADQCQ